MEHPETLLHPPLNLLSLESPGTQDPPKEAPDVSLWASCALSAPGPQNLVGVVWAQEIIERSLNCNGINLECYLSSGL